MGRSAPATGVVETFRKAGAGLIGRLGQGAGRAVLVTSAGTGEGRTTACAGLAGAMGRSGYRVVAVDLDLRHPTLHHRLGAANPAGAAEVLGGVKGLSECLLDLAATAGAGVGTPLRLLPAGNPPADPGELLTPGGLAELFQALAADADVILVDSPPILAYADGLLIGPHTAGAVCVVQERRTRTTALDEMQRSLELAGIPNLGVLFNQERRRWTG